MKLVLFMGSPRKNGNTAALVAPFLEECGQLGIETETVWLYDKTILPCLGCKTCQDRMDGWFYTARSIRAFMGAVQYQA